MRKTGVAASKAKATPRKRESGTENSARKRKQGGRGKPFKPGHEHAFKPGQSGNPGGRPKGISDAYRAWLEQEGADGRTNAEHVAEKAGRMALSGNLNAVIEMREATEGKAVQPFSGLAPDMSDAKDRLAHLVIAVAARSEAPGVAEQPQQ